MKHLLFIFLMIFSTGTFAQPGILTLGIQYKPVVSSRFFSAGPVEGSNEYFTAIRTPRFGHSFGMQIRRGLTKMFSYETGINYIRRNYWMDCEDEQTGFSERFDFGLVGYEIPNQLLFYIQLGENFYMNTATGISLNWFASSVASNGPSVRFIQNTDISTGWIKMSLIANLGFELRTKKTGYYYLGASLTSSFKNIAYTTAKYDENLSTPDKEILLPMKGGMFTVDFRYYFHSDPLKKKANDKKKK